MFSFPHLSNMGCQEFQLGEATDHSFSASASFPILTHPVVRWADQLLLRAPFLTRPPERAKTRSLPKRAHSDRARSASKEAGRSSRLLYCHPDKIFSVIFFYFPQLVAGWKGATSSARVERYTCSFQTCSFLSRDGG